MNNKDKRKTRSSLTRILMALMFCSSWAILGIALALTSANVNLGGSIRFTATDIYADVTGTVTGTATKNTLEDIHFSASTKSFTTPTSWGNMTLDFQKDTDIVITVNVKNNSPERSVWITFTDNITSTNTDITRKSAGATVTGFNILEVPKSETKSIEITLHVTDQNKAVSGKFDLGMHLDNSAPEASQSDIQYTIVDGKAVISEYTGSLTTFSIPETIDGYPTALNSSSTTDAGVTLPSTVTSVVIPGTIETVPTKAFFKNTNLTSVTFGEGVKTIGQQAFQNCSNISSVVIPNSVETVGVQSFAFCSGLKSLTLGNSVKEIQNYAFGATTAEGAPQIETLIIPDSVETIGNAAFQCCAKIKTLILGNSVETIGQQAFYFCSSLKTIEFGNSLKSIGYLSFGGNSTTTCIKVENLVIPDSVETISRGAFQACSYLKTLVLGNSVKTIGRSAFMGANASTGSKIETLVIPDSVETIGEFAFQFSTKLKSLYLGSSLKEIHLGAFCAVNQLESIDLPDSLEYIGDFVFDHCSAIQNTTIKIPKNIKQIGGASYITLDTSNEAYNTQEKVDAARRAVLGSHVFYDCATSTLTAFELDASNEYYMVVDGVLYTKDENGSPITLVAYPPMKVQPNKTYTMPNTVKNAYECSMSRVYNLDKIILSDAFEIKDMSFTANAYGLNGDWANNLQAMMYIFNTVVDIECRSTNTKYYSENGAIYGKDGTTYANTLFYMPIYTTSANQTFTVKAGTTTIFNGAIGQNIQENVNDTVYRYVKISLPASVISIGDKTLNLLNKVVDSQGKTSSYDIEIDSANTVYTVTDGKIVKKS